VPHPLGGSSAGRLLDPGDTVGERKGHRVRVLALGAGARTVGLPVPILCPGTRTPGERGMRRTVMACGAAIVVLAGGCSGDDPGPDPTAPPSSEPGEPTARSEEHTSELQSRFDL